MKVDFQHDERGIFKKTTYLEVRVRFTEEEIYLIKHNRLQNGIVASFGKGDQKKLDITVKDLMRGIVSIPVTNRIAAANIQEDFLEQLNNLKNSLFTENPRQSTYEL